MVKTENLKHCCHHAETLAGLLLSGWGLTVDGAGEKWVINKELRDALLNSSDDVRSHVLWHVERWAEENRGKWLPLLIELLHDVWPKQLATKSSAISERLFDIAFSDPERFPELVEVVLPLLTKFDRKARILTSLHQSHDNIVKKHPHETLDLLHAVLPGNVDVWPYGIDRTITLIGEADTTLGRDGRLIELKRKWNAQ